MQSNHKKKSIFKTINFVFVAAILTMFCTNACKQERKKAEKEKTTAFNNPPNWAKEAIWYQIFVERFRNGDPNNDPTIETIQGFDDFDIPKTWQITPWTQDWYAPDPYFADLDKWATENGQTPRDFNSKVQLRRYGGDLQGVIDQIPYLQELGVNAIYFNPLNDSPSLHKYDPRHWRHIDVNFGPDPSGDIKLIQQETPDDPSTWVLTAADKLFVKLIKLLHKNNIKVILDYSWNHTGKNFWAWQDLVKNQEQSKYKDWFWVESFDDPKTDENEFEYRGWAGVKNMPEIKETNHPESHDFVKAFEGNVYSKAAKEHIFNVSKRWLDPNQDGNLEDGVDGYRLDVAAEMPLGFWRDFRKVVRNINPNAFLVGELWWERWPDELLEPSQFLQGDVFDAPMNYRWYKAARYFFNDATKLHITPTQLVDSLQAYQTKIPEANNYVMMNLTASHDVPRFSTSMFNGNNYKYHTNPYDDNAYKIHKPDAATYQKIKLFLAQQFTYVGAPHIWAGDEMGMWGADDPSTRKPLIWKDFDFEDERVHPLDLNKPIDKVAFNDELFEYYRKLILLRKENPVLSHGKIAYLLSDDEKDVLAYKRYNKNTEIIYVVNNSNKTQTVELKANYNNYKDYLSEKNFTAKDLSLSFTLEGKTALVLIPQSE